MSCAKSSWSFQTRPFRIAELAMYSLVTMESMIECMFNASLAPVPKWIASTPRVWASFWTKNSVLTPAAEALGSGKSPARNKILEFQFAHNQYRMDQAAVHARAIVDKSRELRKAHQRPSLLRYRKRTTKANAWAEQIQEYASQLTWTS